MGSYIIKCELVLRWTLKISLNCFYDLYYVCVQNDIAKNEVTKILFEGLQQASQQVEP